MKAVVCGGCGKEFRALMITRKFDVTVIDEESGKRRGLKVCGICLTKIRRAAQKTAEAHE
jgi:hypothetical protein